MRFCWLHRIRHRWLGLTFIQGRSSTLHHFGNNPVPIEAWKEHPDTSQHGSAHHQEAEAQNGNHYRRVPTTAL
jgi:hypothetical protein